MMDIHVHRWICIRREVDTFSGVGRVRAYAYVMDIHVYRWICIQREVDTFSGVGRARAESIHSEYSFADGNVQSSIILHELMKTV
jgi:hypothetical protein